MTLKVYGDRMSQPTRAVIIFCKVNGIDFEEVRIELSKRQHLTPEFQGINPMKKVPAIVDGRFKLFESHAILTYLACVFPGVADHWYPADLFQRAKIHSVLDWHHSNLRPGAGAAETSTSELLLDCLNTFPMNFSLHTLLIRIGGFPLSCLGAGYVLNSTLAPALGLPLNPKAAAENEKLLSASLRKIESVWLKGRGRFLLGSSQPSIADLSLVCEIMQLELVDEKDRERILGPHQRVVKWIDDTKNATRPHFDEVHSVLYKVKGKLKKLQSEREVGETPSTSNTAMHSKM